MIVLAHFTPAELPGTIAVLFVGVVIGMAVHRRSFRTAALAAAAFGLFAVLSALGDSEGWSGAVRIGIDVCFLASAAAALAELIALTFLPSRAIRR